MKRRTLLKLSFASLQIFSIQAQIIAEHKTMTTESINTEKSSSDASHEQIDKKPTRDKNVHRIKPQTKIVILAINILLLLGFSMVLGYHYQGKNTHKIPESDPPASLTPSQLGKTPPLLQSLSEGSKLTIADVCKLSKQKKQLSDEKLRRHKKGNNVS